MGYGGTMQTIQKLKNQHEGETCYIIGRGPSLATLRKGHIGDGIIIVLNQAYADVEKLGLPNVMYSMQKDHLYGYPVKMPILVHEPESVKESYANIEEYQNAYVWDNEKDFCLIWSYPSSPVAVTIANFMGCKECVMLCHDAITNGDLMSYSEGRLQQPAANPRNYIIHGLLANETAKQLNIKIEWRSHD
jgi:hypothetical protein